MNIAVLMCEIIDHSGQIIFDANEGRIWAKSIYKKINHNDSVALEVACRLRSRTGSYVESVTLGSSASKSIIRQFVSPRISKSVIIVDDERTLEDCDSYYAAAVLGEYLGKYDWDMIFCGTETSDYGGGMTGAVLASSLDFRYISNVVDLIGVDEGKRVARVKTKEAWGRRQVLEICLPAVLAFEAGEVEPGIATFYERIGKLNGRPDLIKIEEVMAATAGLKSGRKEGFHKVDVHKVKPRGIFAPDSSLSPAERVKAIMSGGLSNKKGQVVSGTEEQIVDQIMKFLAEKKIR